MYSGPCLPVSLALLWHKVWGFKKEVRSSNNGEWLWSYLPRRHRSWEKVEEHLPATSICVQCSSLRLNDLIAEVCQWLDVGQVICLSKAVS